MMRNLSTSHLGGLLCAALVIPLLGAGPRAAETGPPDLAAELWVAPSHNSTPNIGDWAVTSNAETHFSFAVPADFGSFRGARVLMIGNKNTQIRYDLGLSISSDGLRHDVFRNGQTGGGPVDLVRDELREIDVSEVFDFPVSGPSGSFDFPEDLLRGEDYISLHFAGVPQGQGRIVGLRFEYDAAPELAGLHCPDGLVAGFAEDGSLICKPDNQFCPAEEVMVGFDLDGAPICKPDSQRCADDEVMVGFDLNGTPICKPDSQACPGENQVMVGFDLDGAAICVSGCGPDELLVGWTADRAPICRPDNQACPPESLLVGFDLSGAPLCKPDSQACPPNEVMVGFDLSGTPQCKTDGAACGRECFGGDNDGEGCTSDEDCEGRGLCQQTVLVGFDLRGRLDCRTLGALQQAPAVGTFSIQSVEAEEGTGQNPDGSTATTPFVFSVIRSPALALAETDTVDFATQDGDAVGGASCDATGVDYLSQSGSLTFGAGDCSGSDCSLDITVEVCADSREEPDEGFQVVLSVPAGSTSVIAQDTGVGTILDDDVVAPDSATLTVVAIGGGVVEGPGILCLPDCGETYPRDTVISLVARARVGFRFAGWSGDCGSSSDIVSVTMDADKTCVATFLPGLLP